MSERTYSSIYGHKRCLNCEEQFGQHRERDGIFYCRTPHSITELWASYGSRRYNIIPGCCCGQCIHS